VGLEYWIIIVFCNIYLVEHIVLLQHMILGKWPSSCADLHWQALQGIVLIAYNLLIDILMKKFSNTGNPCDDSNSRNTATSFWQSILS
jgi:hypothetical protein